MKYFTIEKLKADAIPDDVAVSKLSFRDGDWKIVLFWLVQVRRRWRLKDDAIPVVVVSVKSLLKLENEGWCYSGWCFRVVKSILWSNLGEIEVFQPLFVVALFPTIILSHAWTSVSLVSFLPHRDTSPGAERGMILSSEHFPCARLFYFTEIFLVADVSVQVVATSWGKHREVIQFCFFFFKAEWQ